MRTFLLLTFIFYSLGAVAYQSTLNEADIKIKWANRSVPLYIRNNSVTLTPTQSNNIIMQSIAEWNGVTSTQIIPISSGSNQIKFLQDFSIYGSAVVGITEVSYGPSGNINTASVLLNEQNYEFTTSQGFQPTGKIYLGDVVSHELGHFLGLSHSEVLDSTMFYANYPGQSSLSKDDKAGIRSKYETSYGKIYGYVKGGSQIGILGVHIQAVSAATGKVASGISMENGYFEIGGLDLNDIYYLYTSSLKNLNSLPAYFANSQTDFCPASYTGSFFTPCGREYDGLPIGIPVSSTSPINVGTVSISCGLRIQEDYNYEKIQSTFGTVDIFNYAQEPINKKAYVGYFRRSTLSTTAFSTTDKLHIDLRNFSALSGNPKYVRISLVSQMMANPIEYSFGIKMNNVALSGSPFLKSINSPEGSYNLDVSKLIGLSSTASQNFFDLDIKAKKLSVTDTAYSLPSFDLFASNQQSPYLILVSIWEYGTGGLVPLSETSSTWSDNSSCLDAPFSYAVKKSNFSKSDSSLSSNAGAAGTGCGIIEPPSGPKGPTSSMPLYALGFFLAALIVNLSKKAKSLTSSLLRP